MRMLNEFARIILVINPQSSNIQRIEARAHELAKLFPDIEIETIETARDHVRFRRRLQKSLAANAGRVLLGIGGGDGTVNMVANALLIIEPKVNLSRTILLPLWGGNANDFAHMLNGLSSRIKMKSVFERARVVAIYPLKIKTTKLPAKSTTRYAVCYASFGASAYTADQLDKPVEAKRIFGKSLASNILNEFRRAVRAMLDAPGFDVEQEGQEIKIFEQLFSNGWRMAKVGYLPVRLTDRQFYRAVRSDKPPTVAFYILRLLRGKKLGEVRQKPVRFTTRERAWAQFDGEATVIPENTTVTVGHSRRSLYALSTKLP